MGKSITGKALPQSERRSGFYNTDPYELTGGNGKMEIMPTYFLLPYWQAVSAGILEG